MITKYSSEKAKQMVPTTNGIHCGDWSHEVHLMVLSNCPCGGTGQADPDLAAMKDTEKALDIAMEKLGIPQ